MASYVAKKMGKSAFAAHIASIEPQDPLYEETFNERGKKKRVRRKPPPGLSQKDIKILEKVKRRAHRLDKGISLCGFRVGWTFFIGLIPLLGDIVDALLNYCLIVKKCKQADIPDWLVRQMLFNNAVSAGVGFIPLVGDVILGVWKANSRNAHLFEEYLALRGQEAIEANPELANEPPKQGGWFSGWGRGGNKAKKQPYAFDQEHQQHGGSESLLPGPGRNGAHGQAPMVPARPTNVAQQGQGGTAVR